MDAVVIKYCDSCARRIIASWQGWPHKNAVPLLPKLESGSCPECSGSSPLLSNRITWFNYHSRYNTGLPDYWLLQVDGDRPNWGQPYFAEGTCPKCHSRTVISEMKNRDKSHELMHNCPSCGVQRLPANRVLRQSPSLAKPPPRR
jgi:RNase P subunit RPR2